MEQQEISSPSIETQLLNEALTFYFFNEEPTILVGHSGMNNTTRIIKDGSNLYNLRIYNNHKDTNKLEFEHEVLRLLQAESLDIHTPIPVKNRNDRTITQLSGGKLVALFQYIEGERPTLEYEEHVAGLAAAAAKLSKGLLGLKIETEPAYSPYYELATNYAPLTDERINNICACSGALAQIKHELQRLQQERVLLESICPDIATLPKQWIHGDINCSNALVNGRQVVAILDFEFVTKDVRAMELAVLLAELIKPTTSKLDHKLKLMKSAFFDELALLDQELQLLDQLVMLRIIDVAMHFIDRYEAGLDDENIVITIIQNTNYALTYVSTLHI